MTCTFTENQTLDGTWALAITDSVKGGNHILNAWSITAPSEGTIASMTEATDAALFDLGASDDEDADPLAVQAADEPALMLME